MNEYQRTYPRLSACGLNCGLCPRHHTDGASRCPGCGGEGFFTMRPTCGVISSARRHGALEYCYQCDEYPCKKFEGAACYDSFITHRNMRSNFDRIKREGLDAYRAELDEKVDILQDLLENYNDGRRKSFYCLAVNLLPLSDVQAVMETLTAQTSPGGMTVKEKSTAAVNLLTEAAEKQNISLQFNQKTKK